MIGDEDTESAQSLEARGEAAVAADKEVTKPRHTALAPAERRTRGDVQSPQRPDFRRQDDSKQGHQARVAAPLARPGARKRGEGGRAE